MTHSYGYKRRTRHKFQKGFRSHGAIRMSKNLTTYKVGDIVDVVVDGVVVVAGSGGGRGRSSTI